MKSFAFRLLIALYVLAVPQLATAADVAKPTIIYVSADDCTTCREWERAYLPSFEASGQRKKVQWHEVRNKTLRDIKAKAAWPADLEWLRTQIPTSGTPRFYLIQGERLLATGNGIVGWNSEILPAIGNLGG
jgi:hypothetical protein